MILGGAALLLGFALISRAREGRELMGPPAAQSIVFRAVTPLQSVEVQSVETALSPDSQSAIVAALRSGNKIDAIKLYREATGADLKASKDAVEAMVV